MSKAITTGKKLFSIIGLPRQGTTLISGIFNSFENSFCSIEPHWARIANKGQRMNSGIKVPDNFMYTHDVSQFIGEIRKYLDSSNMEIGSIKETYRSHEKECCTFLINSDDIDVYLFIFREPKAGFNAWRRVNWGGFYNNVDNYISSFNDLWEDSKRLENDGKKVIRITYEDICAETSISYLNNKLKGVGVEFPDINSIERIGSYFGDPLASNGGLIKKSRDTYELLNPEEIIKLDSIKEILYDKVNE